MLQPQIIFTQVLVIGIIQKAFERCSVLDNSFLVQIPIHLRGKFRMEYEIAEFSTAIECGLCCFVVINNLINRNNMFDCDESAVCMPPNFCAIGLNFK
ncbi:hypothetical protein BG46_25250 [Brucella anthropi]|nr:hypothetical protein BG46_25250 [Brucella anthropi]